MTIKTIRDQFVHVKGKDCITAALSNLMRYYGCNLSESMVFGIGMGLRFWYSQLDHNEAFPVMIGQDVEIEKIFCKNLGIALKVEQDFNGDILKKQIESNLPTIVKADPYYLPYAWEESGIEPMHFGEHVLLLVDIDATHVYLSDIWHDQLVCVDQADFLAARTTIEGMPYLLPQARWLNIEKPKDIKIDGRVINSILYNTCVRHLSEDKPYGISGIKQAAEELPKYLNDISKNNKDNLNYILNCIAMRMYEGDRFTMFRGLFFSFLDDYNQLSMTANIRIRDNIKDSVIYTWEQINSLLNEMIAKFANNTISDIELHYQLLRQKLLDVAFFEESLCQSIIQQLQKM